MSLNLSFWKGKRVLITGHTGFKGSWLSYWLSILGAEVKGIALKPHTTPNLFDLLSLEETINSCYCDICNSEYLEKEVIRFDPQIIIHMAAQAIVRESYKNPLKTLQTNIIGTANLLEAARKAKNLKVIIPVTSDKCYENREWHWKYRESDSLGGWDPYSASKGCAEFVVASYRRSFFNKGKNDKIGIATVRAGNVIGGGDWNSDRLIPDIMSAFSQNRSVTIRNPGAIRPWQFILDLLYGYMLLAEKLYDESLTFSGAWNFGPDDDGEKNVEFIVNKLVQNWGNDASWKFDSSENPHEATFLKLDSSKARKLLNWEPIVDIESSLKITTDWYKNYYSGRDMILYTQKQLSNYENMTL